MRSVYGLDSHQIELDKTRNFSDKLTTTTATTTTTMMAATATPMNNEANNNERHGVPS